VKAPAPRGERTARLLDRRLPWLSEQASAVALASFTSLLRAPEAKMLLLGPIIMAVVFGWLLLTRSGGVPELVRPLLPFGGMTMVLFSMIQLAGNQFGFDRSGFRVLVLCPAPRREVLLGKNLAFAPLPLAWGLLVLVALQVLYPMRLDHFLAALPQMLSLYLLFCLPANCLSIFAPIHIAPGAFQASNVKIIPILLHLLFVFLFPLALAPALVPLGIELALDALGWRGGVPVHLLLSVALFAGVAPLYRVVLGWQGRLLQARELHILQVVTSKD
jgi:hypothetical protein